MVCGILLLMLQPVASSYIGSILSLSGAGDGSIKPSDVSDNVFNERVKMPESVDQKFGGCCIEY